MESVETQIYALLRMIMVRVENLLAFEWSSFQNHDLIGHVVGVLGNPRELEWFDFLPTSCARL